MQRNYFRYGRRRHPERLRQKRQARRLVQVIAAIHMLIVIITQFNVAFVHIYAINNVPRAHKTLFSVTIAVSRCFVYHRVSVCIRDMVYSVHAFAQIRAQAHIVLYVFVNDG